ncbi:TPA: hypothetical protein EYP44_00040 [Candidatus Bathyarchaeota archaeon]|nr:hypothetical protein [Candidatus Bathyarchaeota archaeon]
MLEGFGIKAKLRLREIYRRRDGGIIAAFVVTITGLENLRRFRGRIGFANCKKRRSLEDHLRYRRGLRHRALQR